MKPNCEEVYASPALRKSMSKELRARMQGKSCFNFTAIDAALFTERDELAVRDFDVFRKPPFVP